MKSSKFAVFGDSIAKGIIYEDNKLKITTDNVINILQEHYGINIENLSGYGQTIKRIKDKKLIDNYIEVNKKVKSKYAIICIGGNDCDYDWQKVGLEPLKEHEPKTPLKEYESILGEMVNKLKSNKFKVILCSIPPIDAERYFNNVICKLTDGNEVLKFFHGDKSVINRYQECYNLSILKCAKKNNCPYIDIRTEFLLDKDFSSDICEDGIHLNIEGHRKMADKIIKIIDEKLFI